MWSGEHKVWIQHRSDILATDKDDALFLAKYIKVTAIAKTYVSALEVIDLQRYKIINRRVKVQIALRERTDMPFVFVVGKN